MYKLLATRKFKDQLYVWVEDAHGPFTMGLEGNFLPVSIKTVKVGQQFLYGSSICHRLDETYFGFDNDSEGLLYTISHFPDTVMVLL